ncbi:Regulatory associated protein of TOR [Corchorus olitorius]|uniref:Regulatory associated protein of TOR n=1 Tax=Corchorus olitorius TaxID=93759 RepID=A0A1R3KF24_9ROSI|nr:Regulatory associated protein of TOR [Corchorus olitorius]
MASQRRDFDTASTSSYANAATSSATAPTSMAYLPQTIVLCELRHAAFEASTPTGPSDSGLVSKWRPKDRARCKVELDPTVDEVKKLCNTCRRYAKSERVLFHYNGHGVPKPTANGEIWLFNKLLECGTSNYTGSARDCILLAACEAHETLPQSAEFPADVDAWDMAAEICLSQLPSLVEDPNAEFQLTAFEVWLDHGSEHKKPPEQLPIVLQVLFCLVNAIDFVHWFSLEDSLIWDTGL